MAGGSSKSALELDSGGWDGAILSDREGNLGGGCEGEQRFDRTDSGVKSCKDSC